MRPTLTVSSSGDLSYVAKAAKGMNGDQLYIGIPERKTRRRQFGFIGPITQKQAISNAGLLYIHTNGSPKWNIPPRPVIEPSIEANRKQIENFLFTAAAQRLDGTKAESNKTLKLCGQFAANGAKAWFKDPRNNWPQDAPRTIAKKINKLRSEKNWMTERHKEWLRASTILRLSPYRPKFGSTPLDTVNTPLIDTGQLRRAITWVPNFTASANENAGGKTEEAGEEPVE